MQRLRSALKGYGEEEPLLGRGSLDLEQLSGIITACGRDWLAAQGLQLSRELFGREILARLEAFLQLENPSIRYMKTTARREFLTRNPDKLTVRPRRFVYYSRLQPGHDYARQVLIASWLSPYHWHALPLPDWLFLLYFILVPVMAGWKKVVQLTFPSKT